MDPEAETPELCSRTVSDSCPSGHELVRCDYVEGYRCRQCGAHFFQPNENRHKDRCRLRRVCNKPFMSYRDHGSTTTDADCQCDQGFHFQNEDQRACVPNKLCKKGTGQGKYGVCENCIEHNMYSDTVDRIHKCKPLTNCEKHSRCTKTKSNGTADNICGEKVRDVKMCDAPRPAASQSSGDSFVLIIAGSVVASVLLLLLLLLVIFIIRRNSLRRARQGRTLLSPDQLEQLKVRVVKECEGDTTLCKKVLARTFSMVESRIDRQMWTLAQELFRSHPIHGKYEVIVEKYKESQPKYVINGYLQEWRGWRGEDRGAVVEMFHCLQQCKRDDIVYEVCNSLRQDIDLEEDTEGQTEEDGADRGDKPALCEELVEVFCPCMARGQQVKAAPSGGGRAVMSEAELQKDQEACGKLLDTSTDGSNDPCGGNPPDPPSDPFDPYSAGVVYRSHPCPSAPALEEHDDMFTDHLSMHRQYSQPVQATT